MSTIYLIRHGKTEANEKHLYCGKTDLPLSPAGEAELRKLHYEVSAARFITSGMKRTEETLEILFGKVPSRKEPGLREMDFGEFEMRSYAQLKDDPAYQTWITGDNEANVTPGGESGNQMTVRVLTAFHAIAEAGQDTVVITHGGVIAAIMQSLFPQENKNRYQRQPQPGHGYEIRGGRYRAIPEVQESR